MHCLYSFSTCANLLLFAGPMVGNPEVFMYTIVSFIIYDLPRIDGTQNGIANNCVSKHSKLLSQDPNPFIFPLWARFS